MTLWVIGKKRIEPLVELGLEDAKNATLICGISYSESTKWENQARLPLLHELSEWFSDSVSKG